MNQLLKPSFLLLVLIISMGSMIAQTTVYYGYDNSGNRTLRTITLTTFQNSGLKSGVADSTLSEEKSETKSEEKFEDQILEQKITIYPNPTQGRLMVEITGFDPEKPSAINVYNLRGVLVTSLRPLSGSDIIDLSASPQGTYVMKILLGDKVSEWKIIKE